MLNILLCDDDRDIVNALKIYLSAPDRCLLEAHTGREALEIAARTELHLILLDIMMPEMDGIAALAALAGLGYLVFRRNKYADTSVRVGV